MFNKKITFFPESSNEGGLGRHCICIQEDEPDSLIFKPQISYQKKIITTTFAIKIKKRIYRKFFDGLYAKYDHFDLQSKEYLRELNFTPETICCFSGCALRTFEFAKRMKIENLELESPTLHISQCWENYKQATNSWGLEKHWLTSKMRDKMIAEYHIADLIWVNSDLSRQTFLDRGFPESKLRRRQLTPDPIYRSVAKERQKSISRSSYNIVFVGSLTVVKGVPILIDAFRKTKRSDLRLILIGGTSSRAMAKYIKNNCKEDPRITYGSGNPASALQEADLFVLPSWADGYGLAAAEAIVSGVPVWVSEWVGMKEELSQCKNNFIFKLDEFEGKFLDFLER